MFWKRPGLSGCVGVEVVVDSSDPAAVVCIERWASTEADAAYRVFRDGRGKVVDLAATFAGAPTLVKGEIDTAISLKPVVRPDEPRVP